MKRRTGSLRAEGFGGREEKGGMARASENGMEEGDQRLFSVITVNERDAEGGGGRLPRSADGI